MNRQPTIGVSAPPERHPSEEVLLDYASGALSPGLTLLAAVHLNACPACRRAVDAAERAASALFCDMPELAATSLNADAIMAAPPRPMPASAPLPSGTDVPAPLRPYAGHIFDQVKWRMVWPGMRSFKMDVPGAAGVSLLNLRPGMAMPEHSHEGAEYTLVLKGAFEDQTGLYGPGDVAFADDTLMHRPRADLSGNCVCLTVVEAPLRFRSRLTGLISRYLSY